MVLQISKIHMSKSTAVAMFGVNSEKLYTCGVGEKFIIGRKTLALSEGENFVQFIYELMCSYLCLKSQRHSLKRDRLNKSNRLKVPQSLCSALDLVIHVFKKVYLLLKDYNICIIFDTLVILHIF